MSFYRIDPDEWVARSKTTPCRSCKGDMAKCNGMCTGQSSFWMERRPPDEVARIKAEKQSQHEAAVLAEAEAIESRRAP